MRSARLSELLRGALRIEYRTTTSQIFIYLCVPFMTIHVFFLCYTQNFFKKNHKNPIYGFAPVQNPRTQTNNPFLTLESHSSPKNVNTKPRSASPRQSPKRPARITSPPPQCSEFQKTKKSKFSSLFPHTHTHINSHIYNFIIHHKTIKKLNTQESTHTHTHKVSFF